MVLRPKKLFQFTTDRCKFLEQEDRAAQKDLEKITAEAKDTRSAMRAMKEELRQAGDIAAGKPFLCDSSSRLLTSAMSESANDRDDRKVEECYRPLRAS